MYNLYYKYCAKVHKQSKFITSCRVITYLVCKRYCQINQTLYLYKTLYLALIVMINEKSLNSLNESERTPKKELHTEKIHDNLFFCLQEEYNRVSGFFQSSIISI